jgi:hypothetical protein
MLTNNSMRIITPGKLDSTSYMVTYRNFVNLFICYLLHYFVNQKNPLQKIKKLFQSRVNPFVNKKLIIKPWIVNISHKQMDLHDESISFNKTNPGFLLLIKYLFSKFMKLQLKEISVKDIWILLNQICGFKSKISNIILFFRVVERFHDPVDSA